MRAAVTRAALARLATAGLVALAAATLVSGRPASAQDAPTTTLILDRYGWWNKTQTVPSNTATATTVAPTTIPGATVPNQATPGAAQNNVPAPPTAPADGIYVANDLSPTDVAGVASNPEAGPVAMGAVRYVVDEGAEGTLKLTMASSGTIPADSQVLACAIRGTWSAAQNGTWDQRPTYDCNTAVIGHVDADAVSFVLPSYLQTTPGVFDLAIVPAGKSVFQLSFQAPKPSSLTITYVPAALDAAPEEDITPDVTPTVEPAPADATADLPPADDTANLDLTTASPSAPRRSVKPRRPALQARLTANPFSRDAGRGERLMAVTLLLAMAAAAFLLGSRPVRAPRLLGSVGHDRAVPVDAEAPRVGGIGRFTRPRLGRRPPRLY